MLRLPVDQPGMDSGFRSQAGEQDIAAADGHSGRAAGAGARDTAGAGEPAVPELDQVDDGAGDRLAAYELCWLQRAARLPAADGAQACRAVTPQSGSTSTSILLAAADAAKFAAGSIVAVDVDYTGQTGYVGSPVAGAYVRQALTDVDYIRRVTFNVALVSQVTATGLTLAAAIARRRAGGGRQGAGGDRICGSRGRQLLSGVVGAFCDAGQPGRENLLPLSAAADYDRRRRSDVSAQWQRIRSGQSRVLLKGQFLALPVTDPLDGERVVCYRSFLPAANALV